MDLLLTPANNKAMRILTLLSAFFGLISSAQAQTVAGRGTCILSGTVSDFAENVRPKRAVMDRPFYHVTFNAADVTPGTGDGKCAKVDPAVFDSADTNTRFRPGDNIRVELTCHYMGEIHGCEVNKVEIVFPTALQKKTQAKAQDDWVKALPVAPGTSINDEKRAGAEQSMLFLAVSETRDVKDNFWVAGRGAAKIRDGANYWEPGMAEQAQRFEITMPKPVNANCRDLLQSGDDASRVLVTGKGVRTTVNTVNIIKFMSPPQCRVSSR